MFIEIPLKNVPLKNNEKRAPAAATVLPSIFRFFKITSKLPPFLTPKIDFGASWGVLEASWASWERLGRVLGRLGRVLARLGRVLWRLVASWWRLGRVLERLGAQNHLKKTCLSKGTGSAFK